MKTFFSKSLAVAAFAVTALAQPAFADLVVPGQFYATGCVGHQCVDGSNYYNGYQSTASTIAGDSYTMTFGVNETSPPTSEFSVFWNGSLIADVLNPANSTYNLTPVEFTFNNLFATSSATDFVIYGRQDPGVIYFSDLSIIVSQSVPEPESLALVGLGLAGLCFMRRKAKKA